MSTVLKSTHAPALCRLWVALLDRFHSESVGRLLDERRHQPRRSGPPTPRRQPDGGLSQRHLIDLPGWGKRPKEMNQITN